MKRTLDLFASVLGLTAFLPFLLPLMLWVWKQDFHSPFYVSLRVGKGERPFRMFKLRSMVLNAEKSGVDSTGSDDKRITKSGRFMRSYKLDEFPQLWNVIKGDMSLVGPRPNVKRETDLYTQEERRLFAVRPGITDLASIVFSDEGEILRGQSDPDIAYNQLIRPGKGRLGLFYIDHQSLWLDIQICWLTVVAIFSRQRALSGVKSLLLSLDAPDDLIMIASREKPLAPAPPPGAHLIVVSRSCNTK